MPQVTPNWSARRALTPPAMTSRVTVDEGRTDMPCSAEVPIRTRGVPLASLNEEEMLR